VGLGLVHLNTLRRYPILSDNAIDVLIEELNARSAAIVVNPSTDDAETDSANIDGVTKDASYISTEGEGAVTMTTTNTLTVAPAGVALSVEPTTTVSLASEPPADARAASVVVNLECKDIAASITQLSAAVAETKQLCDSLVTEMREMVSLMRGALADTTPRAAPKPAANVNLYDSLRLKP
jgi:hypothetical protein